MVKTVKLFICLIKPSKFELIIVLQLAVLQVIQ